MPITALTGQDLYELATQRLGGYANAVDSATLLSYLNEGKDEIWSVLKSLNADYFVKASQSSDATGTDYFATLNTSTREYALPKDFREMKFIEILGPSGYESTAFVLRDMSNPEFVFARRASNDTASNSRAFPVYYYDIVGKDQMILAQYPETAFQMKLWYTRWLLDFSMNDTVDEILLPYSKKIADFAAQKAMLVLQDQPQFQAWSVQWRADVLEIAQGATPRNISDAVFVQDFLG